MVASPQQNTPVDEMPGSPTSPGPGVSPHPDGSIPPSKEELASRVPLRTGGEAGEKRGTLYLIDAHALIFQVFHAIRGMTSPSGMPTNALFGFVRDLLFLRGLDPDYLLCAFDRSEPLLRSSIYAEYKANRDAMPDDLQLQIPLIHQALDALRVPVVSHPGYEADDVMATIARSAAQRGLDVFLCTTDKDCRQLIDDHISLYNLRKRQPFGKQELQADWGVTPEQVIDLQTLVGDSVDNVPGVPGIGVKTGAKLLQEFGNLDNLVANLDQVKGKKQENLRNSIPILERTRQLVRLVTDVPVKMNWDGWRLQTPDSERMLRLCQEWGFHSLARQLIKSSAAQPPQGKDRASGPEQKTLFSLDGPAPEEELFPFGANSPEEVNELLLGQQTEAGDSASPTSGSSLARADDGLANSSYALVDTPKKFEAFFTQLRQQRYIAFDVETTSLQPLSAAIVGLSFSWEKPTEQNPSTTDRPGSSTSGLDEKTLAASAARNEHSGSSARPKDGVRATTCPAWYLPLRGPLGATVLDHDNTLRRLRPILEDPEVAKVNQNIKFDLLVLRAHGIRVQGVAGDPMIADYLLRAGERSHGLADLAARELGHYVTPITDLIGKKTKKQRQLRMDEVPTERVALYAGEDADVAWRLCLRLENRLEQESLRQLYDELEVPLIEVLAELEYNGVGLDMPLLRRVSADMEKQLGEIEEEIYQLAGHPFNIGSLPQLRKVLFEELQLPVQGRTGVTGAPSTDQETLEKLAALDHANNALPRKILEHRQLSKLKGTYVDALPGMVNSTTGRIHASFNQTVTSTGRLSASDPNLQNIPVRREKGQQIRQAFLPREGWLLLTADYSQIELRLLAHFCGDEELLRAFTERRDVHTAVASQVFHVPEDQVTSAQRRVAKTVNFGVIYGMSAGGLSQRLSIPRPEAEGFIASYFARYPKVEQYQAQLLAECRKVGHVSTILGRRRTFDRQAIRPNSSFRQRNQAEREAINMQVQGSAADLMKLAMLNVYRRLQREKHPARMLLQIHDELVFESPPEELPSLIALVREEMTLPVVNRLALRVPLEVDQAAGPNWLDVEPVSVPSQA